MRPRPAKTLADYEPPSRQILQTPRSPCPAAPGAQGTPGFPLRVRGVDARLPLPRGLVQSYPFSLRAPPPGLLMIAGNCELKRSAPSWFRFHPDPSALALDQLFT